MCFLSRYSGFGRWHFFLCQIQSQFLWSLSARLWLFSAFFVKGFRGQTIGQIWWKILPQKLLFPLNASGEKAILYQISTSSSTRISEKVFSSSHNTDITRQQPFQSHNQPWINKWDCFNLTTAVSARAKLQFSHFQSASWLPKRSSMDAWKWRLAKIGRHDPLSLFEISKLSSVVLGFWIQLRIEKM